MALRNIREYGDEVLRKNCRKVKVFNERLHTLISDMLETMSNANGVGLQHRKLVFLKEL